MHPVSLFFSLSDCFISTSLTGFNSTASAFWSAFCNLKKIHYSMTFSSLLAANSLFQPLQEFGTETHSVVNKAVVSKDIIHSQLQPCPPCSSGPRLYRRPRRRLLSTGAIFRASCRPRVTPNRRSSLELSTLADHMAFFGGNYINVGQKSINKTA